MTKPTFDPGLTQQYTGRITRVINRDGTFNIQRNGVTWRDSHLFLVLINTTWPKFLGIVVAGFVALNLMFAGLYFGVGVSNLHGVAGHSASSSFLQAFFFSAHTLTTVGYGNIYPISAAANTVAIFESLTGLMILALGTSILFARVSLPSARIGYSQTALVSPYQDHSSLQVRVVNRRSNVLIEMHAQVVLMTVERINGVLQRRFTNLDLERDTILMLALTWTIVHPIIETSPLHGKSAEDLTQLQAEVIIFLRGYDETFRQTVHSRTSYRFDEISWNAKFRPAFLIREDGELQLEVDRVSEMEKLP